MKQNTDTGSR